MTDEAVKPLRARDFDAFMEMFPEKACPICQSHEMVLLADSENGDAYEFVIPVQHPPGFGDVPFVGVLCACCGHVSWFLKEMMAGFAEDSEEGGDG